ncbi:hypothetical protein EBZ38_08475 [bacterium]|nr:hypothetical protein [bacterium]
MNPIVLYSKISPENRKRIGVTLILLVSHAAAYSLGRVMTPEKLRVEEKLKVVEVEKQVVVVQEQVRVEKVYLKDEKQRIRREEVTLNHPDGLVETKKTEDINIDSVVREQDVKFVDREVKTETIKYVDREVEKLVVKEKPLPDWRISPMVGLDFKNGLQSSQVVYGGEVQRRILGSVSAGAWGLSSGVAGVSVSLEF